MKLLFRPVNPFYITQTFGENRACVSLDGTKKVITCDGNNPPAGYKSLYGEKGHGAIDIATTHGQEVYAAQDGTVYQIDTSEKSGLDVRIESEKHGIKFRHIYEHLMGYQVKVGDKVRVGQLIGWADNTGYSSGDHLHFQFSVWNGLEWVKNDPMPYMEPTFAPDMLRMEDKVLYLKEVIARLLDRTATSLRVIK